MRPGVLDGLNPEQLQAVQHGAGPLLILAGAGTGKTRTITRRVAWLVEGQGISPGRILAITFTNKAAREMRVRIRQWMPDTALWVGTFHATCARMLRMDPGPVHRSRDFTIVDEEDRRRLIRKLMEDAGWEEARLGRPQQIAQLLSDWKRRRILPERAAEEAAFYGLVQERAAILYRKYEQALERQDCLDFDDLLLKGLELLEWDAQGPRRWASRFAHVLVDEYQDTNELQYLLVRLLSAAHGNLTVCGDPDQSIYRWRGADVGNILRFERDFPGTAVVRLERNYRSVGNVLRAAQGVIRHNRARPEKTLYTDREAGPLLTVADAANEEAEALQVASRVSQWLKSGTAAREIAVFYRTNACSRPLEAAFTRQQIPYQVVGGLSFFERREIKDLLAYGRMLVNPRDDAAVERVLNVPPRGIGQSTIQRLRAFGEECGEPLLQVMRRGEVREALGARPRQAVSAFLALCGRLGKQLASAEEALRAVLDETHYRQYVASMGEAEDVDRGENVDELLAFAAEYDQRLERAEGAGQPPEQGGGLRGFLEEVSLLTDQDRWEEGAQRVSLMTVHTAKGLEFDRVAVVGLEEALFPHLRALQEVEGLEEERRLFYVALTRARLELSLHHARARYRTGSPGLQAPSRFLGEIPQEVLAGGSAPGEALEDVLPEQAAGGGKGVEFRAADVIRHRDFGIGTVVRVLGQGLNQRLVVRFEEDAGERHLLVAYAPLEKLE